MPAVSGQQFSCCFVFLSLSPPNRKNTSSEALKAGACAGSAAWLCWRLPQHALPAAVPVLSRPPSAPVPVGAQRLL